MHACGESETVVHACQETLMHEKERRGREFFVLCSHADMIKKEPTATTANHLGLLSKKSVTSTNLKGIERAG